MESYQFELNAARMVIEEELACYTRFMTVSTGSQRGRGEFEAMEVHHIHVNTLHQQQFRQFQ